VNKERPSAERLADLIGNLVDPVFPPKSVVVSYAGAGAVLYKGHIAENLPPGALDTLLPATATIAPEPYRAEVNHVVMLPSFLAGQDKVTIEVKPVLR
jgi:hypothetical protein